MWPPPRRGSWWALTAQQRHWVPYVGGLDAALRNVPLTLVHVVDAPLPGWSQVLAPAGFRQWQEQRAREFIELAIKVAEESTGECGPVQSIARCFIRRPSRRSSAFPKRRRWSWWAIGGMAACWSAPSLALSSGLGYHAHCPVAVIHDDEPLVSMSHGRRCWWASTARRCRKQRLRLIRRSARRGVGLTALHAWTDLRVSDFKELFPNCNWDAQLSHEEETLAERLAGWQERYPDVRVLRKSKLVIRRVR